MNSNTWDVHTVHSRAQLLAAIGAATPETGHGKPTAIRLGRTMYQFPKGIDAARCRQLVRNIRRAPAKAFVVQEARD
jgi:hypothetical protein